MQEALRFDPRKRLESLAIEIGAYNDEKAALMRAWEGEKERLNDPLMEKPPELKRVNRALGALYGEKEDILRDYPHLEREFGSRKRGSMRESPLGTSPTARANRSAKKVRYLANREARKVANQKAASQNSSGKRK
jgi:hypothetical protein